MRTTYQPSQGDRVESTASDCRGMKGTVEIGAGFIVPGPAWWVRMDNGERLLFDENELTHLEPRSES